MRLVKNLTALMLSYLLLSAGHAEEVHVAVAANFTTTMKEIAAQFDKSTDHTLILSFGSSGKIAAQIQHGAPYQVFLSADQAKPAALDKAGFTVADSRFTYAIGALALWSTKPGFVDKDYTRLRNGDFNKLALANPKLAPYGAAAVEVLTALKLKQTTRTKWVQGENIAQTYLFVASGNADLGFVALSQITDKRHVSEGSSWVIPARLYSPIRQDAVLLKSGKDSAGAKALLNYLRSDAIQAIIRAHGYKTD